MKIKKKRESILFI